MIDELFSVIEDRKKDRPDHSYTVKLFKAGTPEIARKVGEEALEVIIAALEESDERLLEECADLLYHLLVLISAQDLTPAEVFAVLEERRFGGEG